MFRFPLLPSRMITTPKVSNCAIKHGGFMVSSALAGQRRFLGNQARGPVFDPTNFSSWKIGPYISFLKTTGPCLTYNEFKAKCESVRLLIFLSASSIITSIMLFVKPTDSAYWSLVAPTKWPRVLLKALRGPNTLQEGGAFAFERAGLIRGPNGEVKTAAFDAYERMIHCLSADVQ